MKFINREEELNSLEEYYKLSKERLITIAVSGLRRVGKTTLIKEFIKNKKALYFFVLETKTSSDLLGEFNEILKKEKIINEYEVINSWTNFFNIIFTRCEGYVIVFDELQNFYSLDKSVFSIMQKMCDENKERKINLIILGSLVGLFKNIFEDKKKPLYGRISAKINLKPFEIKNSFTALEHLKYEDIEEMIKIYGTFGGYPKYYAALEEFNLLNKKFEDILQYLFLRDNAPLENEVESILKQEFGRRSGLFYAILHSIALGKTKINEIASNVKMKESSITRHLSELNEKFGLVGNVKLFNKKKKRYYITHPLIRFWFKFIYSKFSEYEINKLDLISQNIQSEFNAYFGRVYEYICKEIIVQKNAEGEFPFHIGEISKWEGAKRTETGREELEIDWIALSRKSKELIFVECKWSDNINAPSVINELAEKAKYVDWNNKERKESFAVFAKSFSKKISEFEGRKVHCFDLKDAERTLKNN